jgi:hypothetical protein
MGWRIEVSLMINSEDGGMAGGALAMRSDRCVRIENRGRCHNAVDLIALVVQLAVQQAAQCWDARQLEMSPLARGLLVGTSIGRSRRISFLRYSEEAMLRELTMRELDLFDHIRSESSISFARVVIASLSRRNVHS